MVALVIEKSTGVRPGEFCQFLLRTLEASEAQTRRRKRDQTPDHIGLAMRRMLLEHVIAIDPDEDQFERALLERVLASEMPGPLRAMATLILNEYRFAATQPHLVAWLRAGAPNADADEPTRVKHDHESMAVDRGRRFDFDSDEHWCPICSTEHVRNG
jgi:hypothetical protein